MDMKRMDSLIAASASGVHTEAGLGGLLPLSPEESAFFAEMVADAKAGIVYSPMGEVGVDGVD